jgi:dTDP-4-dehydrorhamnose reductase
LIKVLILGSTGMLGSAMSGWFTRRVRPLDKRVAGYLRRWFMRGAMQYETYMSYKDKEACLSLSLCLPASDHGNRKIYFDCLTDDVKRLPRVDYIINCIGISEPLANKNPLNTIKVNSVFPWELAEHCKNTNTKLIHITSNRVFSDVKGYNTEDDPHDAPHKYGKTKSIGEPNNCMVLRIDPIGEEIHRKTGLVEHLKTQTGKQISGIVNTNWNGITAKECAKICDQIIINSLYKIGKYHVMSPDSVSNHELISLLGKKYNLGLTVDKAGSAIAIDQTLGTERDLGKKLIVPSIREQIEEL